MAETRIMIMVIMVLVLILGDHQVTNTVDAARPNAAVCKLERRLLVNTCKPVLYGKPPSSNCCYRIRATHFQCICSVITPKLAALIDVNRAIRLVEGCGKRVPRHFKCGSITTP
ncbi:OLC1v1031582C1 [Oldenlandia corymbosa var. corymbosa]|uniref:OLC1v1031582C1 n=1 Tax=Oldenlandia corymbosa var. corymbosa TaxID=529605 RepID=A0AAV1CLP4_OLDCO|nr:OLC1v1031582C1 [Oldenlandia corymbosa var. corymbosa]